MGSKSVGIRAVAWSAPSQVRGNEFWRERHPELVAGAEQHSLAKVWARREAEAPNLFDRLMEPYLADPFRGAVERRILAPGESGLTMEIDAAQRALAAARFTASEVDLILVSSFLPDQFGPGNAAYLVRDLGLRCPGINVESACSSALVGMDMAIAMIQAGRCRNALIVVSCSYSRMAPETDTLSWFLGDGAGAILVGEVPEGEGWLATHTIHTAQTCGTFRLDLRIDEQGVPVPRMSASKDTAKIINEIGEPYLRECCFGALAKAGLGIADVDFLVANTPTAWYAEFAAEAIGLDPSRTISTYERFANTGTALIPMNLHTAAAQGRIHPGDRVLLYAVGSVSTAIASVVRWGDVALGAVD
ncbi:3-oxoacyl-ACP synthase III family protein [Nannocystaceae bacterium ST9]